jgi:hypothetical protein
LRWQRLRVLAPMLGRSPNWNLTHRATHESLLSSESAKSSPGRLVEPGEPLLEANDGTAGVGSDRRIVYQTGNTPIDRPSQRRLRIASR